MNIFENYKATKLYIELLQEFEQRSAVVAQEFRDQVKELFQQKVLTDKELDSYKISVNEVQHIADQLWVDNRE